MILPGRKMQYLEAMAAVVLSLLWMGPLLFAAWAAFHTPQGTLSFNPFAAWTFDNFRAAWQAAPWLRYFLNTTCLVLLVLMGQFVICTLAGFAFARCRFRGKDLLFSLVLVQLFVLPEVLIVENYKTISTMGLFDSIVGVGLPYMASAFGVFLLRQAFRQVPLELEDAARIEGCGWFGVLWRVYVPAIRPTYIAYALISISSHWNNLLWPLVVTNSPATRPLTVGLSLFAAPESGVDISIISAGTLITTAPLLIAFLLLQRQFMQAFLRTGIR